MNTNQEAQARASIDRLYELVYTLAAHIHNQGAWDGVTDEVIEDLKDYVDDGILPQRATDHAAAFTFNVKVDLRFAAVDAHRTLDEVETRLPESVNLQSIIAEMMVQYLEGTGVTSHTRLSNFGLDLIY